MPTEIASELERHVVDAINDERTQAGLPELKIEVHLNASAQGHADWMADTGTLSHTGEGGSTATERMEDAGFPLGNSWRTSENVASGGVSGSLDEGEADAMHARLMDSPGHRENILDPDVAYVGVGFAVSAGNVAYLTENFADTDGQVLGQEEDGDQTVLQSYIDGQPVGEPVPAEDDSDDPGPDPDPAENPDEEEEESTATAGGACFVATAAYGDPAHPDVVALRSLRDDVLVRHPAGRAFVHAYRTAGPMLAPLVAPDRSSGRLARALIAPLARLARKRC